jgi:hypothetical protein
MQIPRFSPLDDDETGFDSEQFEAGYDARHSGAAWASSATRSWRAGWCDAEAGLFAAALNRIGERLSGETPYPAFVIDSETHLVMTQRRNDKE